VWEKRIAQRAWVKRRNIKSQKNGSQQTEHTQIICLAIATLFRRPNQNNVTGARIDLVSVAAVFINQKQLAIYRILRTLRPAIIYLITCGNLSSIPAV
jgi:hypothetical protein